MVEVFRKADMALLCQGPCKAQELKRRGHKWELMAESWWFDMIWLYACGYKDKGVSRRGAARNEAFVLKVCSRTKLGDLNPRRNTKITDGLTDWCDTRTRVHTPHAYSHIDYSKQHQRNDIMMKMNQHEQPNMINKSYHHMRYDSARKLSQS